MGDATVDLDNDPEFGAFNREATVRRGIVAERYAREQGKKTAARLRLAETLAAEYGSDPLTVYNVMLDCKWNEGKTRRAMEAAHG